MKFERQATETTIIALIAPVLLARGYELVRVQLQASSGKGELTLQIMAERQDGKAMLVEDCTTITHAIDVLLDEADPIPGAYALEVSSAGIDRPLTREKDFINWAGFEAKIMLSEPHEGRKNFRGIIRGIDDHMIQVEIDGAILGCPFASLAKAQLVLTNELIKATAAKEAAAAGIDLATIEPEKKTTAQRQRREKRAAAKQDKAAAKTSNKTKNNH